MFPLQWEFRVLVVSEPNIGPAFGIMAFLTDLSVFALMLIVQLVAGDAGHVQLVIEKIASVTGVTDGFLMPAGQLELGFRRVIEPGFFPCFRGVAFFALFAVAATVTVVDEMTGYTDLRRLLVAFPGMT